LSARTVADHHRCRRLQARFAALDVDELLGAEIGTEAGFRHHVVGKLQAELGGDHRIAAMGDVGERAAMDEGRVVLERLHQVRRDRILEQYRHGAVGVKSRAVWECGCAV
jgi:hypothetical protein